MRSRNPSVISFLIKRGADVNAKNYTQRNALHYVTNSIKCKWLLDAGAEVNNIDLYGNTPLHVCFEPSVAVKLLEYGANVNVRNTKGRTPLFLTSFKCSLLLLEHGADMYVRDHQGETAYQYSVDRRKKTILAKHIYLHFLTVLQV